MNATLEDDKVATRILKSTEYIEVATTKGSKMIDAFSPKIIHAWMKTALTGVRLNVITHTLCAGEGPFPPGLTIQNAYTKMHNGGKSVAIVVRNSTVYPQTLKKKIPMVRVVGANQVPELQVWPGNIDALDEAQGIQTQKLTAEQRRERLFRKLDLSSLGSWLPELADSAYSLLAEYHDIFSLEPCELSCTHSTEHVIKVTNDAPFKEQFRWIPPPLVEEICAHLQEMLDSGTIHPSQSTWCKAVVLVQKKDGSLFSCIDFCRLNTCTKKDTYPLPRIQKALVTLVGTGHFSCPGLKSRF